MKKIICKLFCFLIGCLFSFCCYSGAYSTSLIPSATVSNSNPTPTSKFVTVTTNRPVISDENYSTLLSPCPQPISGCPDINGLFNGQVVTTPPKSCPDSCTVTRYPEVLNGENQTNYVSTKIINPICPTGYASVGTFNVQNEATYSTSPAAIRPVKGMTNYYTYRNAGYDCSFTYGDEQLSGEYCRGAFTDGEITASVDNANGNVVKIVNSYRSSCHCSGSCLKCDCWLAGTGPRWTYRYHYVQCITPAGVYLTGNKVPVSLVCARVKSAWSQ